MDVREYIENEKSTRVKHPWETARTDVVYILLNSFMKKREESKIIDVGCGDAVIINSLSEKWKETRFYGVDTALNDSHIEELNKQDDSNRISLFGNYEDLKKKHIEANTILLLDILEHIEDDSAFLNSIINSTFVSKEALFLVTVPAYKSLFVNRDIWLGHHRRYTVKKLTALAEENNLEIIRSGYFFASLLPIRLAQKIFEKKKTPTENYLGINNWNGSRTTAFLVKNMLMADFHITNFLNKLGIKMPGLSCYMICRKQ
jgi:hypothetical protein